MLISSRRLGLSRLIENCETSSVGGEEVLVSIDGMDYHFQRAGHFSETYMVFGGGDSTRTVDEISIFGIGLEKARAIHAKYPDFYKCKSPGAAEAQRAVLHLQIIPTNSEVSQLLKDAVKQHERNLGNDGDRIFVRLEGNVLKLSSAIIAEVNGDVTDQLPSQMRGDYYLVDSVEVIEAKIQLKIVGSNTGKAPGIIQLSNGQEPGVESDGDT